MKGTRTRCDSRSGFGTSSGSKSRARINYLVIRVVTNVEQAKAVVISAAVLSAYFVTKFIPHFGCDQGSFGLD